MALSYAYILVTFNVDFCRVLRHSGLPFTSFLILEVFHFMFPYFLEEVVKYTV
jgi:hypothetical protein